VDHRAAGPAEEAIDRTGQAIRLRRLIGAGPARIEQFLLAKRAVVRIDDRAGSPFDFSPERDLNIVGCAWPGRREDKRAGAAPLGDLQVRLLQAAPKRIDGAAVLGELRRHPGPQFANPRAIRSNYRTDVAPVVIVDPRDAELKAWEGVGEGWDEVVVSRDRVEVCEDGLDGTSVRETERGGVH
jgi:hypothetical protein